MIQIHKKSDFSQAIPDNHDKGMVDTFEVTQKGKIEDIKVNVNIEHPFIGDLQVTLTSPSGKSIVLHDRVGGNHKNLTQAFGKEKLENLIGSKSDGKWKLKIKDTTPRDSGTLHSWSIDMRCSSDIASETHIPDKNAKGLQSVQECRHKGQVTKLKVKVDVEHPFIGDLQVALIAPSGKSVVLHNREGGNKKNLKKTYSGKDLAELINESCKGNWALQLKDFAPRDAGRLVHWRLEMTFQSIDDLKKVEGIGPKIEQLLNAAGIWSWSTLACTNPSAIRKVLTDAGDRFKMHNPASWGIQAQMAADGKWAELEKWQDEHDHGRLN